MHVEQQESDESDQDIADGGVTSSSESSSDSDSSESESETEDEDSSSSSEEEDLDNVEGVEGDVPLYPNARISRIESLIMILTLALRFALSGDCIVGLLELIELHCPAGNFCITTLHNFKKFFMEIGRQALVLHYFCDYCLTELESKDSECVNCEGPPTVAFFIEIPIFVQLQRLFLRPGFVQSLQYRFNRVKKHQGNYEDLYDGNVYKEQMANNGFLRCIHNISFTWYTDGVQIFKSTKFSVWPLYFSVNELSYKERTSKENVLLCGLWFGKSKPKPNLFLKPFRETFKTFKRNGYQFNVPDGPPITVKGILLFGTCDLPAKSLFLRTKMYNGYYGCSKCLSPGVRVPAGRTTVHVHPYIEPHRIQLRSKAEIVPSATQALATGKSVRGYKGISRLYYMMPCMIRGTSVDVMHCLFLNICKLLMKFWFAPEFSGEPFSCYRLLDAVNERLSKILPPSFVQRMTRTLTDLKLWKAKEYKLWFFYYSVAVLNGVLDKQYLFHHIKLVSAISLLCQESIFPEQLDRASELLNQYVRDFQQLYGLRFMGMNVHLLLHLVDVVRETGPLWVNSCFFWEDLNGQLVKLIHGPHQPGLQICSSASLFMSLQLQIDRIPANSIAKNFCLKLRQVGTKFKTYEVINEKTSVTGRKAFKLNVPIAIRNLVRQVHQLQNGRFMSFFSLRKKGVFFDCESRHRSLKRCSQYGCFDNNGVPVLGRIKQFVRWSGCNCVMVCHCQPARYFCVVQVFDRIEWLVHERPNAGLFHMSAVVPSQMLLALTVDQITSVCFYYKVDNVEYISIPINRLEYE